MKTKIYVMTHMKFHPPMEEGYVPLQVGRALGQDLGYLGDNTGENISKENPFFGELTGLYWIWKNDVDADYIGINHYRRFFTEEDGALLRAVTVEQELQTYDLIAPIQVKGEDSHYETYKKVHHISDMDAVRHALEICYPEYVETFDRVMATKEGYYGNLCVMRREVYMAYCEWLFTILLKASKEIDVSDYDAYHKRVYGFLSEPLLKVYVEHHQLKVKEHGVVYTSEKAETMELKLAVGQLLRMGQASEAQQLFQEFVKLRPDVKLPASDIKRELPCIELLLYIIQMEQQYGVEGLYTDTKELGELIEHLQWIREWIRKEKEQEELGQELQEKLRKIHISSVAKEIISLNLEF